MVLDRGTAVLARSSSSDGKSPDSGSEGSSSIGYGAGGRGGDGEMSWVRGVGGGISSCSGFGLVKAGGGGGGRMIDDALLARGWA